MYIFYHGKSTCVKHFARPILLLFVYSNILFHTVTHANSLTLIFCRVIINTQHYIAEECIILISYLVNINSLWSSDNEQAWLDALEHYYSLLSDNQLLLDKRMEAINAEEIKNLSVKDFYIFLHDDYYVWKYTQKNRLATTRKQLERYISESRIYELEFIMQRLFLADRENIFECLSLVSNIRGLGVAGASGLLSILFPHDFGTVDQFVVMSLLNIENLKEHSQIESMNPQSLKTKDGEILIRIMRQKAASLNAQFNTSFWTPRKIDMILWSIGR